MTSHTKEAPGQTSSSPGKKVTARYIISMLVCYFLFHWIDSTRIIIKLLRSTKRYWFSPGGRFLLYFWLCRHETVTYHLDFNQYDCRNRIWIRFSGNITEFERDKSDIFTVDKDDHCSTALRHNCCWHCRSFESETGGSYGLEVTSLLWNRFQHCTFHWFVCNQYKQSRHWCCCTWNILPIRTSGYSGFKRSRCYPSCFSWKHRQSDLWWTGSADSYFQYHFRNCCCYVKRQIQKTNDRFFRGFVGDHV